jgi:hypothetical protein
MHVGKGMQMCLLSARLFSHVCSRGSFVVPSRGIKVCVVIMYLFYISITFMEALGLGSFSSPRLTLPLWVWEIKKLKVCLSLA